MTSIGRDKVQSVSYNKCNTLLLKSTSLAVCYDTRTGLASSIGQVQTEAVFLADLIFVI